MSVPRNMYCDPFRADTVEWLISNYPIKIQTDEAIRNLRERTEYPPQPTKITNAKKKRKLSEIYSDY